MSHDDEQLELLAANPAMVIERLLAVGQLDRAREMASGWLAANPDDPDALMMLALIAVNDDRPSEAMAALQQVLSIEPDLAHAHYLTALAQMMLGHIAAAEQAFLRAIRLDPEAAGYRRVYAEMLTSLQQPRVALSLVTDALALDPEDSRLHALQARLLLLTHPDDWQLSEEAARRAVRLDPEDADAHAILATLQLRNGNMDVAEDGFRRALFLEPDNQLALSGLVNATKARYPLYRPMLWYSGLMARYGQTKQITIVLSAWAVMETLRQVVATLPGGERYAELVFMIYLAFCAYTWFANPITKALLRRRYPWMNQAGL